MLCRPCETQSDGHKPADLRNGLDANPRKPKDKPLRIKRGHRKSAVHDADAKNSFKDPASPASESHSQRPESQPKGAKAAANGVSKLTDPPSTAFELYCRDARPVFEAKGGEGDVNVDEELVRGWKELPEADKTELRAKAEVRTKSGKESDKERKWSGAATKPDPQDDDVEMVQYDTENQETQMDKDGED